MGRPIRFPSIKGTWQFSVTDSMGRARSLRTAEPACGGSWVQEISFFGQTIQQVALTSESVSGFDIAFWARFTNGNSGIFVANVPEPNVTLLITLLGGWFLARR